MFFTSLLPLPAHWPEGIRWDWLTYRRGRERGRTRENSMNSKFLCHTGHGSNGSYIFNILKTLIKPLAQTHHNIDYASRARMSIKC